MEIKNLKIRDWDNILATFSVKTEEGFVIHNFRLVNGPNGRFAGAPSKKGEDGKWYNQVTIPNELQNDLNIHATIHYNSEIDPNYDPEKAAENEEELPWD